MWLAAPSGPTALLLFEQAAGALLWFVPGMANGARRRRTWAWTGRGAAGALLWFVLAAAKRVRPPSALDAKLFLLAPWGPIAFYFLYRIQK